MTRQKQENKKKENKKDIPFYKRKESYTKCGIVSLIGCLLMIIGTVLYWKNILIRVSEREYSGISFLSIARKGFKLGYTSRYMILPILLVLFYAVVIFLAVAGYKDNIARKDFYTTKKKRIRLIALAITVILVVAMTFTPLFRESQDSLKSMYSTWKSFVDSTPRTYVEGVGEMYSYYFIGPGFISYVLGVILYIVSIGFNFVLETLNEESED